MEGAQARADLILASQNILRVTFQPIFNLTSTLILSLLRPRTFFLTCQIALGAQHRACVHFSNEYFLKGRLCKIGCNQSSPLRTLVNTALHELCNPRFTWLQLRLHTEVDVVHHHHHHHLLPLHDKLCENAPLGLYRHPKTMSVSLEETNARFDNDS